MTRDEIHTMAHEAGMLVPTSRYSLASIEYFAAVVAAAEREACAKACEAWAADHATADNCTYASCDFVAAAHDCASAIRARK